MHTENHLESAQQMVDYYQRLAEGEDGAQWLLGLFMTKRWVALLQQECPDKEEVELLVRVLEAEKMKQGSGWLDLTVRVGSWAETLGTIV